MPSTASSSLLGAPNSSTTQYLTVNIPPSSPSPSGRSRKSTTSTASMRQRRTHVQLFLLLIAFAIGCSVTMFELNARPGRHHHGKPSTVSVTAGTDLYSAYLPFILFLNDCNVIPSLYIYDRFFSLCAASITWTLQITPLKHTCRMKSLNYLDGVRRPRNLIRQRR